MSRSRWILGAVAVLATLALAPAAEAKPRKKPAAAKKASKKPPAVKLRAEPVAESAPASTGAAPTRGPTRIDFDDRLIQGQTNKSGAVYLYDRKELKQRSMIQTRESFRDEIVENFFDS